MKKLFKFVLFLFVWAVVIPSVAGCGIMWLWNLLLPSLCGFATIGFVEAVGLFFLGQLLSAGFVAGVMLLGAVFHACSIHPHHHHGHWHEMTDEQRREFFERRRQWFDMMHQHKSAGANA